MPKTNQSCADTQPDLGISLRNIKFDFWNVHGIMTTSGLLQSK